MIVTKLRKNQSVWKLGHVCCCAIVTHHILRGAIRGLTAYYEEEDDV
jgi:hypothetical protein